jgi:hypothetical protein
MQKKMQQKKAEKTVVLVLKSWRFYVSSIENCIVASCECGEFTEPGGIRMAASHGRSWQTARAATLAHPGRATSSQVSWHWAGDVNSTGKIEQFKKKSQFIVAMVF